MTRKDSEKDSERPHYYSQFWLDVAAGRRVIGGPRPEEGEAAETEASEPAQQRSGHSEEDQASNDSDDYFARATTVSSRGSEETVEPDIRIASDVNDEEPYQDEALNDLDIPDMDIEPFNEGDEEETEDEEYYDEDENEDEEEDEDMNWGRGRKRGKPSRTASKLPPRKPGRREPRRGF